MKLTNLTKDKIHINFNIIKKYFNNINEQYKIFHRKSIKR